MTFRLVSGDCLDALSEMEEASVDAVVTDPPYGISFMGKEWDGPSGMLGQMATGKEQRGALAYGGTHSRGYADNDNRAFQVWTEAWATELLRVLKPGGHLLAFGGTRTYHRLASGIEDAGFEIRDCLAWMYGSGFPKSLDVSKAIDKAAGAEREVVGQSADSANRCAVSFQTHETPTGYNASSEGPRFITAPATEAARQWQGWGTALKPAWEVVVVAEKPSSEPDIIRRSLWLLEHQLRSLANDAEGDSGSRPPGLDEAFDSAGWTAERRRNTRAALCEETDTSRFESALTSCLNIVTLWQNTLDDLCGLTNTSITGTASETTTALRTLNSSLSDLTPDSIIRAAMNQPGSTLDALPAARSFAAVESRLRLIRELLVPAPATSESPTRFPDEAAPELEPIILARKPLTGTVAANVQEFGTGALNVDGCRVEGIPPSVPQPSFGSPTGQTYGMKTGEGRNGEMSQASGRWPANVILDGEAAELLDEQTGNVGGGFGVRGRGGNTYAGGDGFANSLSEVGQEVGYGDTGGASRFFASFSSGPGDMLCVLCGQPYATTAANPSVRNEPRNGSADGDVQDSPPPENEGKKGSAGSPAKPAESSSTDTQATAGSSALPSAESRHVEKIVRLAKSAAHLCDLCETATARNVVRFLLGQIPEPPPGQGSIVERRRLTLSRSLAPIVAGSLSTGIIPTTETLNALCGSAVVATTENTTASDTASDGGPTRFRYVSKASRAERNAGLDGFEKRAAGVHDDDSYVWPKNGDGSPRNKKVEPRANHHPTVKPIDLMRYLVRLVTPPGGTVLDPFTGSGTTGIAAGLEGFDFVGIEREAEYREIAEARLKWWADQEGETVEILRRAGLAEKAQEKAREAGQASLFDEEAA